MSYDSLRIFGETLECITDTQGRTEWSNRKYKKDNIQVIRVGADWHIEAFDVSYAPTCSFESMVEQVRACEETVLAEANQKLKISRDRYDKVRLGVSVAPKKTFTFLGRKLEKQLDDVWVDSEGCIQLECIDSRSYTVELYAGDLQMMTLYSSTVYLLEKEAVAVLKEYQGTITKLLATNE